MNRNHQDFCKWPSKEVGCNVWEVAKWIVQVSIIATPDIMDHEVIFIIMYRSQANSSFRRFENFSNLEF